MPGQRIRARNKRWAIEYTNSEALKEEPDRPWIIWHWYKSEADRDRALAKLQRIDIGFEFRAKNVLRDKRGRKIYPQRGEYPNTPQS